MSEQPTDGCNQRPPYTFTNAGRRRASVLEILQEAGAVGRAPVVGVVDRAGIEKATSFAVARSSLRFLVG